MDPISTLKQQIRRRSVPTFSVIFVPTFSILSKSLLSMISLPSISGATITEKKAIHFEIEIAVARKHFFYVKSIFFFSRKKVVAVYFWQLFAD